MNGLVIGIDVITGAVATYLLFRVAAELFACHLSRWLMVCTIMICGVGAVVMSWLFAFMVVAILAILSPAARAGAIAAATNQHLILHYFPVPMVAAQAATLLCLLLINTRRRLPKLLLA